LLSKIESNQAVVGIIGLGYVGLPLLHAFHRAGFPVVGFDVDARKIEALKRFKNDATEVKNGIECGISLANFNAVQVGDVIEAFTMQRVAAEMPQPVAQ